MLSNPTHTYTKKLSHASSLSELKEIARVMSHVTLTLADVPPPPKPLQEDDHFILVAESLPHPKIPSMIQLTSSDFYHHIAKFSKTVIVFCVNCMYMHAVVYIITIALSPGPLVRAWGQG